MPPPYSRYYMGGENDVRGFDIWSISPAAYIPTTQTVPVYNNDGTAACAADHPEWQCPRLLPVTDADSGLSRRFSPAAIPRAFSTSNTGFRFSGR